MRVFYREAGPADAPVILAAEDEEAAAVEEAEADLSPKTSKCSMQPPSRVPCKPSWKRWALPIRDGATTVTRMIGRPTKKMQKVIARNMIVMVREINARFPDGKQHVTCYTCHQGSTTPLTEPPAKQ
ncbi:MAG TPA: photosynthetic reaction center cytochrome c subunit family protein [Bryobacteraceae bacterium]|nr:photosynthetic reaction center cytochrome c subunit family protein [Bryobacteraceae bacterium]